MNLRVESVRGTRRRGGERVRAIRGVIPGARASADTQRVLARGALRRMRTRTRGGARTARASARCSRSAWRCVSFLDKTSHCTVQPNGSLTLNKRQLLVAGLFPSLPGTLFTTLFPISPFSVPPGPDSSPPPIPNADSAMRPPRFLPDLDRGHRAAAAALAQTRVERAELGPERRAGVRRRVRGDETEETRREEGGERPAIAPPPPPAVDAAPAPGEKRGGV